MKKPQGLVLLDELCKKARDEAEVTMKLLGSSALRDASDVNYWRRGSWYDGLVMYLEGDYIEPQWIGHESRDTVMNMLHIANLEVEAAKNWLKFYRHRLAYLLKEAPRSTGELQRNYQKHQIEICKEICDVAFKQYMKLKYVAKRLEEVLEDSLTILNDVTCTMHN